MFKQQDFIDALNWVRQKKWQRMVGRQYHTIKELPHSVLIDPPTLNEAFKKDIEWLKRIEPQWNQELTQKAQKRFGFPDTSPKNNAQCRKCGDIIESKSIHDWVSCSCGAIFVDGGHDYIRRGGNLKEFRDTIDPSYSPKRPK